MHVCTVCVCLSLLFSIGSSGLTAQTSASIRGGVELTLQVESISQEREGSNGFLVNEGHDSARGSSRGRLV